MSANSGWLKWSHEGTVVVFPEAITGQAQSFASVSSSSWQRNVRAPDLQYQRPPSTSLGSVGLICATRATHSAVISRHHGEARKGKRPFSRKHGRRGLFPEQRARRREEEALHAIPGAFGDAMLQEVSRDERGGLACFG